MSTFLVVIAVGIIAALALQVVFSKTGDTSRQSPHPVDEARVFAAYGQKKRALAILQGHLQTNPGDASARELLDELERG